MADDQNQHKQEQNGSAEHPLPGQYAGMGPERPEQMGAERRIIEQTREGAYLATHDVGAVAEPDVLAPGWDVETHVATPLLSTRERLVEGVGAQDLHDQVLVARVNDILRARIAEVLERPRGPIEFVRHAFSNQRRRLVELLEGDLAAKQASAAALGVVRGVDWAEIVERSVRQAREEIFHRSINDTERLQTSINGLPQDIRTLLTGILGANFGDFRGLETHDHAKILARKIVAELNRPGGQLEERLRAILRDLPMQSEQANPDQVRLTNEARAALLEIPDLISKIQVENVQFAQMQPRLDWLRTNATTPPLRNELSTLEQANRTLTDELAKNRQKIIDDAKLITANLAHIQGRRPAPVPPYLYLDWITNTLSRATLNDVANPTPPPPTIVDIDLRINTPIPERHDDPDRELRAVPAGPFDRERVLAAQQEFDHFLRSLGARQPINYFELLFRLQMAEYGDTIHNVEQRRRASLAEIFFQEQLLKNDATRSAGNRERSRMAERRGQGIGGWLINQLEHSFTKRTLERFTTNYYNAEETFQHLLPDFDPEFRTWLGKVHKSGLNISHVRLREFSLNDPNFDHKKLFKFAMRMGQVISGLEIGGQRRIQVRPEDVPLIERFIEQTQRLYTEVEATNALAKFDRPSDPDARDKNHAEYLSKVLYEANRARDEFEKQVRKELVEPASEWRNWFRKSFYMEKLKEAKAQAKEQGLTPAQTRAFLKNEALYNLGSPARKQMRKALSYAKSFLFRTQQVGSGIATGAMYGYKGAKWGVEKGIAGTKAVGRGIKWTAGKGVEATKWTLKAPFRAAWWGVRAPFRGLRWTGKKAYEVVAPAVKEVKEGVMEVAKGTGFVGGTTAGTGLRAAVFPFECMQAVGGGVVSGFNTGFGRTASAAAEHGEPGGHVGGGGAHGGGGHGAKAPEKSPADEAD